MYCEENYPIIPIIIIKTRGITISTLKLGNQFFFSSFACSNVLLINIESLSSTHKSTAHTYFIYFKSFIVYCKSDVVYDEKGKFDHFVSFFHFTLLSTSFISMKKRLTNHFMSKSIVLELTNCLLKTSSNKFVLPKNHSLTKAC